MKQLLIKGTLAMLLTLLVNSNTAILTKANGPSSSAEITNTHELNSIYKDKLNVNKTTMAEGEVSSPTLLPGDFLYVFKVLMEKLSLMLQLNETDKANILANIASERIAEVQLLMEQGEIDLALAGMRDAIIAIQESEALIYSSNNSCDKNIQNDVSLSERNKDIRTAVKAEVKAYHRVNNEENIKVSMEKQMDVNQSTIKEKGENSTFENKQKEMHADSTDLKSKDDVNNDNDTKKEAKLKSNIEIKIFQNLVALINVIENVENPVAKAVLVNKIEDSLTRSDTKIKLKKAKRENQLEKQNQLVKVTEGNANVNIKVTSNKSVSPSPQDDVIKNKETNTKTFNNSDLTTKVTSTNQTDINHKTTTKNIVNNFDEMNLKIRENVNNELENNLDLGLGISVGVTASGNTN
jgi:hypothetical protein